MLQLHLAVGFADGVENADGLGLGQQGANGFQLEGNGQQIAGAGHITLAQAVLPGQARLHGGGNGGVYHGHAILRRVKGANRHGGGDGADQIVIVVGEIGGDIGRQAHIRLGVFIFDGEIFALHIAAGGQALQKPFPAVIQRAMHRELSDGDGNILFALRQGAAAQRERKDQGEHQGNQLFHGDTSFKIGEIF